MNDKKNQPILKKRNWGFVLYPESLPADWKEILFRSGLPIAISPLHDKDLNPDGEAKKAHFHALACFSGPVSESVVKRLTDSLNAPKAIPIDSVRGNYRYFTHQDNPEKAQYEASQIECLNGFNILDFVEYSKSEVLKAKKDLVNLILEQGFFEYCDFINYVLFNCSDLFFDVASGNTIFFNSYLKSAKFKDIT